MNMVDDENDRPPDMKVCMKMWKQQTTILQARKQPSMEAAKKYGDHVLFETQIINSPSHLDFVR